MWSLNIFIIIITQLVTRHMSVILKKNFFERLSVHLYVGRWSWVDAVDENFALVGAEFHAVFSRCFLQSLSELLKFFFTAGVSVSSASSTASSAKQSLYLMNSQVSEPFALSSSGIH